MNNLNTYITEKLKINSKSKTYDYEPKTKDELKEVINKIKEKQESYYFSLSALGFTTP